MKRVRAAKTPNAKKRKILPSQQRITDFFPQWQPDLAVTVQSSPTALSKFVASSSTPDAQTRFSVLIAPCPQSIKTLTASSVQSTLSIPIPLSPHSPIPSPTAWYSADSHPSMQSSARSLNHANLYLPLLKNSALATHTPVGSPRLVVNRDRLAQTINAASSAGSSIINAPGPAKRSNNPFWPNGYSHGPPPSALRSEQSAEII